MEYKVVSVRQLIAVLCAITMAWAGGFSQAQAAESSSNGGDLHSAIAAARAQDPAEFDSKIAALRTSDALMSLFAGAPDDETVTTYLEFFAMHSSSEQVAAFVQKTDGKHFVVSGTAVEPIVTLEESAPLAARGSCCACWRAWVASAAYWFGTGLLCTAVGAGGAFVSGGVGAVSGFMCGGVFWAIEKLPNFDSACK